MEANQTISSQLIAELLLADNQSIDLGTGTINSGVITSPTVIEHPHQDVRTTHLTFVQDSVGYDFSNLLTNHAHQNVKTSASPSFVNVTGTTSLKAGTDLILENNKITYGDGGVVDRLEFFGKGQSVNNVVFGATTHGNTLGIALLPATTTFTTTNTLNFASANQSITFTALTAGKSITFSSPSIIAAGDLSFLGSAGFYPRLIRQNDPPANGIGATQIDDEELLVWIDTNDSNKIYLVYNDNTNTQIKKVELAA